MVSIKNTRGSRLAREGERERERERKKKEEWDDRSDDSLLFPFVFPLAWTLSLSLLFPLSRDVFSLFDLFQRYGFFLKNKK